MLFEEELSAAKPQGDSLLTIGVFDGVHLGHKYLIAQLKKHAAERNLRTGIITFKNHPDETVARKAHPPILTTTHEKVQLLKNEGVDFVIALTFTPELAKLTARDFVTQLQNKLRMKGLVIGHDFALGKGREGNAASLRVLGQEMGFTVEEVHAKVNGGDIISSTAIRNALAGGDMKRVHRLLGRFFSLEGPVVTGEHIGTKLGFPTANIKTQSRQALPADGVYATRAFIGDKIYPSMTNIGTRPTFGEHERTVEVFILDFHGDIYGTEMKIELIERLRGEVKFASPEALKQQIAEDIQRGRAILAAAEKTLAGEKK